MKLIALPDPASARALAARIRPRQSLSARPVRWGIAALLALGIVISFFDRINVSVATGPLMAEFHLSKVQMGFILSSYLWSYALLQIPVGVLLDRIGIKWLMRVGIALWALATFMTSLVSGMGLILLSRILLGIAESPTFPAAAKATGYWFPRQERGLATSAFDAAAKFSNVVGVPLIATVVGLCGWRAGFAACGILTLFYGALFWWFYRDPAEHPRVSQAELDYIRSGGAQTVTAIKADPRKVIGYLLRQPKIWGLTLGFGTYGYAFYMLLSWLPGYLQTEMGLDLLKTGIYTVIPWTVATITDLLIGGWLVDHLIRRGCDPARVRKTLIAVGMGLGLGIIGPAFTRDPNWAIFWISVSLGGLAFVAPIGWSLPGLVAPEGTVGTVGGLMNTATNLMGIAAPIVTGYIAGVTGSFGSGFVVAAAMLLIGVCSYLFLLRDVDPIPLPPELG